MVGKLKLWMLGGWEVEMMDTGRLKLCILCSWDTGRLKICIPGGLEPETTDAGWLKLWNALWLKLWNLGGWEAETMAFEWLGG